MSTIWNKRIIVNFFCAKKEIIAPGYYSRKYGIYNSADSEQLFLVQNRSTIPSDDNDLMY